MKAAQSIRKFIGRWVTIILKSGIKLTVKVKKICETLYGHAVVMCQIVGTRELKQIAKSDIIDVYA